MRCSAVVIFACLAIASGHPPAVATETPDGPNHRARPERVKAVPVVSFAGVQDRSASMVFICDASGSMIKRLDAVIALLTASIEQLDPGQRFNVAAIHNEKAYVFRPTLVLATPENKKSAGEWLGQIGFAMGTSQPVAALEAAFEFGTEAVFFLCDGFDHREVLPQIWTLKRNKATRLHTITPKLDKRPRREHLTFIMSMKLLALESGGQYSEHAFEERRPAKGWIELPSESPLEKLRAK